MCRTFHVALCLFRVCVRWQSSRSVRAVLGFSQQRTSLSVSHGLEREVIKATVTLPIDPPQSRTNFRRDSEMSGAGSSVVRKLVGRVVDW